MLYLWFRPGAEERLPERWREGTGLRPFGDPRQFWLPGVKMTTLSPGEFTRFPWGEVEKLVWRQTFGSASSYQEGTYLGGRVVIRKGYAPAGVRGQDFVLEITEPDLESLIRTYGLFCGHRIGIPERPVSQAGP